MDSRYIEYVLNTWPQCYRQGLPGRQWYRVPVFTYIQTDVRADRQTDVRSGGDICGPLVPIRFHHVHSCMRR